MQYPSDEGEKRVISEKRKNFNQIKKIKNFIQKNSKNDIFPGF